ncbi:DUF3592 domain-containing protein [Planctomycetota bacterium]|nr:DUF3592 domain-containing protein [Planctomycetota bacterium]
MEELLEERIMPAKPEGVDADFVVDEDGLTVKFSIHDPRNVMGKWALVGVGLILLAMVWPVVNGLNFDTLPWYGWAVSCVLFFPGFLLLLQFVMIKAARGFVRVDDEMLYVGSNGVKDAKKYRLDEIVGVRQRLLDKERTDTNLSRPWGEMKKKQQKTVFEVVLLNEVHQYLHPWGKDDIAWLVWMVKWYRPEIGLAEWDDREGVSESEEEPRVLKEGSKWKIGKDSDWKGIKVSVLVAVAVIGWLMGSTSLDGYRAQSWVQTDGVATYWHYEKDGDMDKLKVYYSYEVDGVEYYGEKMRAGRGATSEEEQAFLEGIGENNEVKVFYNPENVEQSALLRAEMSEVIITGGICLGVVMLGIAVIALLSLMKMRKKRLAV